MAACTVQFRLPTMLKCSCHAARRRPALQHVYNSQNWAISAPMGQDRRRNGPQGPILHSRLQAVQVADVAQLGEQVAEVLGVLGIGAAGLFIALWNTEKSAKAMLEQDLQQVKEQLASVQQEVQQVQQQLQHEQQARKEAESWKPRLDEAQKELFKLERALEMKDAQLATFMTTAHRQIKSLEDSVKELQKF